MDLTLAVPIVLPTLVIQQYLFPSIIGTLDINLTSTSARKITSEQIVPSLKNRPTFPIHLLVKQQTRKISPVKDWPAPFPTKESAQLNARENSPIAQQKIKLTRAELLNRSCSGHSNRRPKERKNETTEKAGGDSPTFTATESKMHFTCFGIRGVFRRLNKLTGDNFLQIRLKCAFIN